MNDKKLVSIAVLSAIIYVLFVVATVLFFMSEDKTSEQCKNFGLVVKTTSFDVKSMIIRTKCERR